MPHNLFDSLQTFSTPSGKSGQFYSLPALQNHGFDISRLPVSIRVVLESVLRNYDDLKISEQDVRNLASWKPNETRTSEIPFVVARIVLQDFTGVPLLVDLAAMRSAAARAGKNPEIIEPLVPVDLIVDHSVQVDFSNLPNALQLNMDMEFKRNASRYQFLKWGMGAFQTFSVVPPGIGIIHQVNLEFLAKLVIEKDGVFYPDTLVGTDSHTTMINGLGVVGWGVGGIEAEAGMLGQPVYFLTPDVVGVHLSGSLKEGVTATDLVLRITEMLRAAKVVGKFVEFYGQGASSLTLPDRATIANMAPEYGATMGFFPVDDETLNYLKQTGRSEELIETVRAYYQAQGMFGIPGRGEVDYSQALELDLGEVVPAVAGPKRPQDRIDLPELKGKFSELFQAPVAQSGYNKTLEQMGERVPVQLGPDAQEPVISGGGDQEMNTVPVSTDLSGLESDKDTAAVTELEMMSNRPTPDRVDVLELTHREKLTEFPRKKSDLGHGDVVIAAITSCTNTSNPSVMLAAGLLAQKAVERGLKVGPTVKTSLAPGSRVVTDYLDKTGLQKSLDALGFYTVGYGCTTCIAAGTPVLQADGTARAIESFPEEGGARLFAPGEGKLSLATQSAAYFNGVRECVSLVLQDGRELICTPDHQILSADGRWVRADELQIGVDRALVGLEAPTDAIGDDENGYTLRSGEWALTMEVPAERAKALAFARLLGHLLHDGSISLAGQGRICVGQALDREMVLNDIELICGKRPAANRYDERKWSVVLPIELTAAITALAGVRVGKRIHQAPSLPAFVLDEACPKALVREFLGGAFGADGWAPSLKRLSAREEDAILTLPAFSQSALPGHVARQHELMEEMLGLLERCGVNIEGAKISQYPTRRAASSYAAGQDGAPRVEVRLQLADGLSFVEHVGYRFCVDKMLRASAAAVYWRTLDKIGAQRLSMAHELEEIHQQTSALSFSQARAVAQGRLLERETAVFPHYSLLEGHDRFSRLPQSGARKFQPLHRDSCGFPSPVELFRSLGVREWFAPLKSSGACTIKRYCAEKEALTLPAFALGVIDRRPAGLRAVFDLSVEGPHSFIAGGVAVHNCIGNSGPLDPHIERAVTENDLVVASVLSGNRNFEARVHQAVKANFLMSPPLVVAFALAGRVDWNPYTDAIGQDRDGKDVFLADIWPSGEEVADAMGRAFDDESYSRSYEGFSTKNPMWNEVEAPTGAQYDWDESSTYIQEPPFFEKFSPSAGTSSDIKKARPLGIFGDSVTTDHISPAGAIKPSSPAGKYLQTHGVEIQDFNSYGSRRGNDRVMTRGTFANVRIKNLMVPGVEGGVTIHQPDGEQMSIFDASIKYQSEHIPLVVFAGQEYGTGSSRDWAAKGTSLLGVKVVVAQSYERIHRSNLVGMGVLPLQFKEGTSAQTLGLAGTETFDFVGLSDLKPQSDVTMIVHRASGETEEVPLTLRIDTPIEVEYFLHGGILPYVLRQLMA